VPTTPPVRFTPLMAFYLLFAVAGAVVPWFFNIKFVVDSGELITPHGLIAGGFVTPLASSLTSDFLIGTTPVLVWVVVEARRLGMRHWWVYLLLTFLIAFAFACPLFLFMRERRLQVLRAANDPRGQ
jgi:Terpene cyclase DEP1